MIRDPIRAGLASGWKVTDASALERDLVLDADVAIVGTGAGGGVTAEILAEAGLDVVL
ncbi:MAG: GMC family oxidoreductase, partial [Bacteroidota bacterium]